MKKKRKVGVGRTVLDMDWDLWEPWTVKIRRRNEEISRLILGGDLTAPESTVTKVDVSGERYERETDGPWSIGAAHSRWAGISGHPFVCLFGKTRPKQKSHMRTSPGRKTTETPIKGDAKDQD